MRVWAPGGLLFGTAGSMRGTGAAEGTAAALQEPPRPTEPHRTALRRAAPPSSTAEQHRRAAPHRGAVPRSRTMEPHRTAPRRGSGSDVCPALPERAPASWSPVRAHSDARGRRPCGVRTGTAPSTTGRRRSLDGLITATFTPDSRATLGKRGRVRAGQTGLDTSSLVQKYF